MPLIEKNGRTFSVRTTEELDNALKKEMESLSPEEREALQIVLAEMQNRKRLPPPSPLGTPKIANPGLLDVLEMSEYTHAPVDVKTFIKDPYFLGNTCDSLYPKYLDDLIELFDGGYSEAILCLHPDTPIPLLNGETRTLKELADQWSKDSAPFWVYGVMPDGKAVPAQAEAPRQTGVDDYYRVTLDDGTTFTGNARHQMVMRDGTKRMIQDMRVGDIILPYRQDNRYVVSVTPEGRGPVYCMTVPATTNFAIYTQSQGINRGMVFSSNTGAIGIGKCVAGDTEVYDVTNGTRRLISDLGTFRVPSMREKTHTLEEQWARSFASGFKPCVRITLENGQELEASTDHPVYTDHGWVQAAFLEGLRVAVPADLPYPSKTYTVDGRAEAARLPLTERLPAAFYGLCHESLEPFLDGLYQRLHTNLVPMEQAKWRIPHKELCIDIQHLLLRLAIPTTRVFQDGAWVITPIPDAGGPDNFLWSPVQSVTPVGTLPVYDLSVDTTHNFFANQMVVHNSFFCSIGICRILYEISCLKDPHKTFGLAKDTNITLAAFSVNEELATKVVFENIKTKITASPYFQAHFPFDATKKELRFPHNVWVAPRATTDTSALGLNVISAFMDEGNFLPKSGKHAAAGVVDHADVIYSSMKRRMKSRFERKGKLPGILFIASSKTTSDDFVSRRLREAKDDPTIFVRDYCLAGDTRIPLLDGSTATLKELTDRYGGTEERFEVQSYDLKTGQIVVGRAHHPRLTAVAEQVLEVRLDNGQAVYATAWHPFLLQSGVYQQAAALKVGDSLMPTAPTQDPIRVALISPVGAFDVYDLSVEGYENFGLEAGIFVHNSLWDIKPEDYYSASKFQVLVGNESAPSKILEPGEHERIKESLPEGTLVIDVPEDFRHDFERDLEGCLTGDTKVCIGYGEPIAIQDLLTKESFDVIAFSEKGVPTCGRGFDARLTHTDAPIVEVRLSNGRSIRCTPNHPFMLQSGTYCEARFLEKGAQLMPTHEVVSVLPAGKAPVYDISVETHHNFLLDAGVVVHNSIKDIAGCSVVSVSPFIQRREKIVDAVEQDKKTYGPARHPFSTFEYDASKGGKFLWDKMVQAVKEPMMPGVYADRLRPLISPNAARHIHIDIGLRRDALGFCMAHVAGYKDVVRRGEQGEHLERAPIYVVDLMLRVIPPSGDEIILGDVRRLIYELSMHGYTITSVSTDSYNSADMIQQLNAKGFNAKLLSVDTSTDPYENLKISLYEDRVFVYEHPILMTELRQLQRDYRRGKVDHPQRGCFTGDTEVLLADGSKARFDSLLDLPSVEIVTFSGTEAVAALGLKPRLTKYADHLVEVQLSDGGRIHCTPDHRFLLTSGAYKEAQHLTPRDTLCAHKPVRIAYMVELHLEKAVPVYDLTVPKTENFALAAGPFVHNSKDCSDALAGALWTLSQQQLQAPVPFIRHSAYAEDAWLPEQMQAAMAGQAAAPTSDNETYEPLPFFIGSGPLGGRWG